MPLNAWPEWQMLGRERGSKVHWDPETAREIAMDLKDLEGPLLPILHAINERFGYISNDAIVLIADVLNLTRADVQGVVGFYHDFRREPAGRQVTLLPVYCLGNCALSPSVMVDGELHGRMDEDKVLALVHEERP